ncbi:hypothetical protein [Siphonobacter sp. SORGH_AS_0500]|uniref:hypothetical protein n=1 Tax=Siphonobacter sp. SORGH_AS_0500 TaxID=1864824 RepID=UPI00285806BB|nr:hypothetical protein [Siphonobacter sp. SORGH_AS_0500]MDR6193114.1 acyl-CoA hydrolase [Siphonobacter sp. SORGH_AS_0500]
MKNYWIALVILIGTCLMSCNREDLATSTSTEEAAEVMTLSAARVAVAADSVTKQKCKGKLTAVDISTLSSAITTYIQQTYPTATIKLAASDEKGNLIVGITVDNKPKALLFTAAGVFVQELSHYQKQAKLTEVALADLPTSITTYITAHYAGATLEKAGKNADGVYFVAIKSGNSIKVLRFDASGTFVEELAKEARPKKRH